MKLMLCEFKFDSYGFQAMVKTSKLLLENDIRVSINMFSKDYIQLVTHNKKKKAREIFNSNFFKLVFDGWVNQTRHYVKYFKNDDHIPSPECKCTPKVIYKDDKYNNIVYDHVGEK